MRNKIRIAVCLASFWLGGLSAEAALLSPPEKSLIAFYGYARTIEAIRVDIERFAVYHKGNHGLWEERIAQDLQVLRLSEAEAREKSWPAELELLSSDFVSTSEALEGYAEVFLKTSVPETDKAEDLFNRRYVRFRSRLEQAAEAVIVPADLAEDFDPLDEEYGAFPDKDDRETFRKAAFLLEERRFDVALVDLTKLGEKYRGTSAEGVLALRMVRCVLRDNEATIPSDKEKAQIQILDDLISRHVYYPNLYDIFVEWRTLYQGFYFGVAPDTEIPNLQYLGKWQEVAKTLSHHLEVLPSDAWARSQLWMLMELPVITRNGTLPSEDGNSPGLE